MDKARGPPFNDSGKNIENLENLRLELRLRIWIWLGLPSMILRTLRKPMARVKAKDKAMAWDPLSMIRRKPRKPKARAKATDMAMAMAPLQ